MLLLVVSTRALASRLRRHLRGSRAIESGRLALVRVDAADREVFDFILCCAIKAMRSPSRPPPHVGPGDPLHSRSPLSILVFPKRLLGVHSRSTTHSEKSNAPHAGNTGWLP
jgi:hypothetical protein